MQRIPSLTYDLPKRGGKNQRRKIINHLRVRIVRREGHDRIFNKIIKILICSDRKRFYKYSRKTNLWLKIRIIMEGKMITSKLASMP